MEVVRACGAVTIVALIIIHPALAASNEISAPNKIPRFYDFRTPIIKPSEHGNYNFTVKNRYDKKMENITIVIEIYMYATLDESKMIDKISHAPIIKEGNKQSYTTYKFDMPPNGTRVIGITIVTDKNTPQGTYFVRHSIEFEINGIKYIMKSRGFFSSDEWSAATTNPGNGSYGGINLTLLGVDGIVPDSSFSVKEPPPVWPLVLLVALAVFFGVLSFIFYAVEEEKGYSKIKKCFYYFSGKLKKAWRLKQKKLRK